MLSLRASRPRVLPALLIALGAATAILVGCGNDSSGKGRLLSAQESGNLQDTLTRVQQDVAAKNCTAAGQEVTAFQQEVDSIRRLNRRLRSALRASSRRLETLVSDNCQSAPAAPVQTQTTPTDTGTTGPSGKAKKEKKPKPEKPPKDTTPPGQDGQPPPGQQNGGGGAGVPGESGGDGTGSP
jgi:hypothetical protein